MELIYKNTCGLSVKAIDDNYVFIKGYASTFGNVDRHRDMVIPGAFKASLAKRMPKMLKQHYMNDVIGVIDVAVEDEKGLYIEARLPKANSMVKDLEPLLKMGALGDFSIGYNTVDSEVLDDGTRLLKELDLWEVSIVTIPANPEAKIESVKGAIASDLPIGPEKEWDKNSAIARVRKFTESEDAPSAGYKKAFLWFDESNADNFGSYKLPIADVIDGKLMAMPRAIHAAAGVVNGARGGLDIPASDKKKVIATLKKYYNKMGEDAPFGKSDDLIISVSEAEQINTKREFEQMLIETGMFTRKAAVTLASRFNEIQSDSDKNKQSDSVKASEILKQIENIKKGYKHV